MPYSDIIMPQFRDLVKDQINKVTFEDEKDFVIFCQLIDQFDFESEKLNDARPAKSNEIKNDKFIEDIQELKDLITEGFDLYAGNDIIYRKNFINDRNGSHGTYIDAFTSDKKDDADKLKEAKAEFKRIIIDEIHEQITHFKKMNFEQRKIYIQKHKKRHGPRVIEKIKDNEYFEYKGNVRITGSIGANATVVINEGGSLIVDGNVGNGSTITIGEKPSVSIFSLQGSLFVVGGSAVTSDDRSNTLFTVRGHVGNGVKVVSDYASIHIVGKIGESCNFKTNSGNIHVVDVGDGSILSTMSGNIYAHNVGKKATLRTMSGDASANDVGEYASVTSMSGDVSVRSKHESAAISYMRRFSMNMRW